MYWGLNLFHKCEIRISTFIQLMLCHFTQSLKSVIYYTGLSPDDFSVAYIFYSLQRDSFWTLASKIMFCYRSLKNKGSWLSFMLYYLFLITVCVCVWVCVCCSVASGSLQPRGLYSPPDFSPGKNTGVDCNSLLQGIFPTQESNPDLLHCRQIPYHLSYREVICCYHFNNFGEISYYWKMLSLRHVYLVPICPGWCQMLLSLQA